MLVLPKHQQVHVSYQIFRHNY